MKCSCHDNVSVDIFVHEMAKKDSEITAMKTRLSQKDMALNLIMDMMLTQKWDQSGIAFRTVRAGLNDDNS